MVHKLSKLVQLIFRRISVELLLSRQQEEKIEYDDIRRDYLHDLMITYHKEFTDTEVELQLMEVQEQIKYIYGKAHNQTEHIDAFEVLFVYIPEVLEFYRNKVVCKYQKLLEWNELVRATGEDLPVITMRIRQDFNQGTECMNFAWKPIIGHNNTNLDRILSKGLADNHFHLRGSSSYFDISWINLMNYPTKDEFRDYFKKIEKMHRDKDKKDDPQIKIRSSYWIMSIQAALIRLYLCSQLNHIEIKLSEYFINTDDIWTYINQYESFLGFSETVSDIKDSFGILSKRYNNNRKNNQEKDQEENYKENEEPTIPLYVFLDEWEKNMDCSQNYPYILKFFRIFCHEEITKPKSNNNRETLEKIVIKLIRENPVIKLDPLRGMLPSEVFKECWHNATLSVLLNMLQNPDLLKIRLGNIQTIINGLYLNKDADDYMLTFLSGSSRHDEVEYKILSGERWFLYHMLKNILKKDPAFTRTEKNLFFVYIRIKNDIRGELIQVNDLVGFENFQIYQDRKDYFSHVRNFLEEEGKIARLAVRDVLNNKAVQYLEVRISPGNTIEENLRDISGYDNAIIKPYNKDDLNMYEVNKASLTQKTHSIMKKYKEDDLRNRFYYVYHFTKQEENLIPDNLEYECRHYQYRKKIAQKADAIMKFREKYPTYGQRIFGIDACSMEVGCRPEVFGCVFRELKNHTYLNRNFLYNIELPQLRITYHVGEEFLDIVDGLRAVDEAIRFLELDCGDRLGHALALGINVEDWYIFKGKQISLARQDYLDNIVWMHHALIKYHINDMSSLKGWLEEKYAFYFNSIYLGLESNHGSKGYITGNYDINSYYLSWLLRGDNPELYTFRNGEVVYHKPGIMDFYSISKLHVHKDKIRNIPEVTALYYMYHYSTEAKKRGREKTTVSISDEYIKGVIEIQKALREDIVQRGIGIETNPTSNVNISVIKGYEEHPIKTFYNLGLTANEKEIMECPQMNVSINTDDKGVFSTCIENEYAMLASALENVTSPDKKTLYKRECIYAWLDNIREMGLRQAFGNDRE